MPLSPDQIALLTEKTPLKIASETGNLIASGDLAAVFAKLPTYSSLTAEQQEEFASYHESHSGAKPSDIEGLNEYRLQLDYLAFATKKAGVNKDISITEWSAIRQTVFGDIAANFITNDVIGLDAEGRLIAIAGGLGDIITPKEFDIINSQINENLVDINTILREGPEGKAKLEASLARYDNVKRNDDGTFTLIKDENEIRAAVLARKTLIKLGGTIIAQCIDATSVQSGTSNIDIQKNFEELFSRKSTTEEKALFAKMSLAINEAKGMNRQDTHKSKDEQKVIVENIHKNVSRLMAEFMKTPTGHALVAEAEYILKNGSSFTHTDTKIALKAKDGDDVMIPSVTPSVAQSNDANTPMFNALLIYTLEESHHNLAIKQSQERHLKYLPENAMYNFKYVDNAVDVLTRLFKGEEGSLYSHDGFNAAREAMNAEAKNLPIKVHNTQPTQEQKECRITELLIQAFATSDLAKVFDFAKTLSSPDSPIIMADGTKAQSPTDVIGELFSGFTGINKDKAFELFNQAVGKAKIGQEFIAALSPKILIGTLAQTNKLADVANICREHGQHGCEYINEKMNAATEKRHANEHHKNATHALGEKDGANRNLTGTSKPKEETTKPDHNLDVSGKKAATSMAQSFSKVVFGCFFN